jgi:oxygen-independent coproporphyrinogen-3 oxidase
VPGFYIHVPFCARRCPYCDFAVTVNGRAEFRDAYVQALKREIKSELSFVDEPIETVFCGGGTPTELSPATLNSLLELIQSSGKLSTNAEISLEANPENLDFQTLNELRAGGWNRLSLGVQSFDEGALQFLGRRHDGARVERVVDESRSAGFDNVSLDLIFGDNFASRRTWRETLNRAVSLNPQHISCYGLTIESGTHFGELAARGALQLPGDDAGADMMDEAVQILGSAGLERYEVSNWARAGWECRHNQNYWRGGDYLAAGCGAHGHRNGFRYWNERDAKIYTQRMKCEGTARAGDEHLSPRERLTEIVALGIRAREGFDLNETSLRLNLDVVAMLEKSLTKFQSLGMLEWNGAKVSAQPHAFAVADGLATGILEGVDEEAVLACG